VSSDRRAQATKGVSARSYDPAVVRAVGRVAGYLSPSGLFAQAAGPSRSAPRVGAAGPDALRRHFECEAIRLLREASAAGFRDKTRLRAEPLPARLRPLPEFQALLCDVAFPTDPFAGP
jgi:hypothetical protein